MSEKEILKEIERYIKGELSQPEIDALWMEFLKNPEYYHLFETDLHFRQLAKESKSRGRNPFKHPKSAEANDEALSTQRTGFTNRVSLWFGAIAAIVIIGFGIHYSLIDKDSTFASYSMSQIDVNEMTGTDIFRSEEDVAGPLDIAINQGLAYAYSGNDNRAKTIFERVLDRNPNPEQKARAEMNLGILLYNQGEYELASDYLRRAADESEISEFFEERALWFLANTYLKQDMPEESKIALSRAIEIDGRFRSDAERLLGKIDDRLASNDS